METYRVVRGADGYETITVQKQQTRARSHLCSVDRVAQWRERARGLGQRTGVTGELWEIRV